MSNWETCPKCGNKLTFTEVKSQHFNGLEREVRYEDIGWCETCWEDKETKEWYYTAEDIYEMHQLDNDINQMKEDRIE